MFWLVVVTMQLAVPLVQFCSPTFPSISKCRMCTPLAV